MKTICLTILMFYSICSIGQSGNKSGNSKNPSTETTDEISGENISLNQTEKSKTSYQASALKKNPEEKKTIIPTDSIAATAKKEEKRISNMKKAKTQTQ